MDKLRNVLSNAKKELKQQIKCVPPGMEMEFSEMEELENQLKKYIRQGENILRVNLKKE